MNGIDHLVERKRLSLTIELENSLMLWEEQWDEHYYADMFIQLLICAANDCKCLGKNNTYRDWDLPILKYCSPWKWARGFQMLWVAAARCRNDRSVLGTHHFLFLFCLWPLISKSIGKWMNRQQLCLSYEDKCSGSSSATAAAANGFLSPVLPNKTKNSSQFNLHLSFSTTWPKNAVTVFYYLFPKQRS